MCGISGFITSDNSIEKNIKKTLALMRTRGPDNQNYLKFFNKKKITCFLHSRLNIIDLKKRSNQPFKIGDYSIIFNGEIYNYLEIRENLKKKYSFRTKSDTEVLLYSFIEYGERCYEILNGMWSFAIWNDKEKSLFLSRDPFGEKPLYYTFVNNNFFFGSEIKYLFSLTNLNKIVNKKKINNFLFNGYKSIHKNDETFFEKIKELPSGSFLKIDKQNNFQIKKYFYPKTKQNLIKDFDIDNVIKKNRENLIRSVELRMRADVPLAFCLSGGIDSGSLVSIASKILGKKVSCFSILDTDERYNEIKNIKKVIKDCNAEHHPIILNNKVNFFEKLNKLVNYHDSPISTISYYIHSYLLEEISKNDFKVSISGSGADELYTGYYDHYLQYFAASNQKSVNFKKNVKYWEKFVKPNLRNPALKNIKFYSNYPKSMKNVLEKHFNLEKFSKKNSYINKCKQKYFSKDILRNRMMNELFYEVVPVILKHDDNNSMMNSVENRSPFLDKDLLNSVNSIPTEYLIKDGFQKYILRASLKDILTDDVRLDRKKKGFNASINSLIDLKDQAIIEKIFNKNNLINEYVDLQKLKKNINFNSIPNHLSKFIFSIISSEAFLIQNS